MNVISIDYNWGQHAEHYNANECLSMSTGCEGSYEVGKYGVLNITLTVDERQATVTFKDRIIKQRNINRIVYEKEKTQ